MGLSKKPLKSNNRAFQATRRNHETASRLVAMEAGSLNNGSLSDTLSKPVRRANILRDEKAVKIVPLGGLGEVGKNLNIIEYGNDAIVVDAGFKLGIDLPSINYAIPDFAYLEEVKHKIRGYLFTHGHLDHIGAAPFVLPIAPAPCYGSRLTLGMLEKQLEGNNYKGELKTVVLNPENHDRVMIGPFGVELIRVTHSIPDSVAALIDTPVGRILHTGDFKFDPNPLDGKVSDLERFEEIGRQGVLLLMSDSTNSERLGCTPTEHYIEPTLDDLISRANGRAIISVTSTNINRIQMIINSAVKAKRKIAIDGRSMLANIEMAFKLGYIKIPRGVLIPMRNVMHVKDAQLAIISTGHQGEINSVLTRMASGEHKFIKLKKGDTVILSSSPIPGNERAVTQVVDRLMREGAKVYQNSTKELDNNGLLHVSGHGSREELETMLKLTKPIYFMPIHGEYHHQVWHAELANRLGIKNEYILLADNGDVLSLTKGSFKKVDRVSGGMQLVDQTGALVPDVVLKDRLLMSEDGIVVVVLTIETKAGRILTSPDIISRGFIHMKESEELVNNLRTMLRQFTIRRFKRVELSRFKQELRDEINNFLFRYTERSPIIIPVVNSINGLESEPALRVPQDKY